MSHIYIKTTEKFIASKAGICLTIIFANFIYYLPILINPNLILNRNNDLQEFFWPFFYYIKSQFIKNHQLPLWNNLILSGTPLLPDPQFSLSYLPNLLFLLLPINNAFIIYIFLHLLIGSIGTFLLSFYGFRFSKITSFFVALLYLLIPKLSGFIEAGHMGLVAAQAWLPLVILAIIFIVKKPNLYSSLLLSISLSAIFYTHTIIFIISCSAAIILYAILVINNKFSIRSFLFLILGFTFMSGLIAITFLPQLEWLPQTTRFLLLNDRDVYPKWNSILEYVKAIFWPWSMNIRNIQMVDTEKWLCLGFFTIILAFMGFLKLSLRNKIFVLISCLLLLVISMNNLSPLNKVLLNQNWFILMRVTTRVWFITIFLTIFLAGLAVDNFIKKRKFKKIIFIIMLLTITELFTLSWIKLLSPIEKPLNIVPQEVVNFIKKDSGMYRIYCVNRCISQQQAATNNLEMVDGYNTLIQKNYYQESWQLTGAYWNYYTLSIPPMGTYTFEKPQPDPISLGEYNTKYIISTYPLTNFSFKKIAKFGKYIIYQNLVLKPRAYFIDDKKYTNAKIDSYSPNQITVNTINKTSLQLTLSEVYSNGWNGYLNGILRVPVQQKPNALRLVDITPQTKYVVFKYEPKSFEIGKDITLITILIILILITIDNSKKYQKFLKI